MPELNVQVEVLSPVLKRLKIEVPAERVSSVTDSVYVRLGQTVKLRGYRQGHVPRRVLEKHFADQVRSEVAREVMKSTFPEALVSTSLSPVAEPTIEPEDLTLGAAFHYAARIEVRPDIALSLYKGLEVAVEEATVSDAAISNRLEGIRQGNATLEPIEGRDDIQIGDVADVSHEILIEGRAPEKAESGLVDVDAGNFLDGHGEKLVGMKVGETRELQEVLDQRGDPKLAGKTASIKVTLKAIKKRVVPDLDDELAKDQELENLDALKAKVKAELESEALALQNEHKRAGVLDALVEKNPVEVPPALVDMAATRMAYQLIENVMRSGLRLDLDSPLIERVKKDAIPAATREVKNLLLLEAVAKAENLSATPEELDARVKQIAERERQPVAKVYARYAKPDARQSLIVTMRNEKALDLLVSSAVFTIKAPEPAPAPAPAEETATPAS